MTETPPPFASALARTWKSARAVLATSLAVVVWAGGCSEPSSSPPAVANSESEPSECADCVSPLEKALGLTVTELLESKHFQHHPVDAPTASRAVAVFEHKLDPHKLLFLRSDVEQLEAAAPNRDELRAGRFPMVDVALKILPLRIRWARALIETTLSRPLDLTDDERLETDPAKRAFCGTEAELADRWRRVLEANVLEVMVSEGLDQDAARQVVAAEWKEDLPPEPTRLELVDAVLDALANAFDPHTTYMPPARKAMFDVEMSGSVIGVGIVLQVRAGTVFISEVLPQSPATDKLMVGDRVLRIVDHEGKVADATDSADDRTLSKLLAVLWGPVDTKVTITVQRAKGPTTVELVRKLVTYGDTFARGALLEHSKVRRGPTGYIRLPRFYGDTRNEGEQITERRSANDVRRILDRALEAGANGVILDLRDNVGGFLEDAGRIAGLFVPPGPVAQIRSSEGETETLGTGPDAKVVYSGPLVVLVNHKTASSAEVLAAILKDRRRAVVVGTSQTFGKGSIQRVAPLDKMLADGAPQEVSKAMGVLKVTRHQVFRVGGQSIQRKGVEPDIVLPDFDRHESFGERNLPNALPWASIDPLAVEPVGPDLVARVAARSSERVRRSTTSWGALLSRAELQKTLESQTLLPLSEVSYRARRKERLEALRRTVVPPQRRCTAKGLADEPQSSWHGLEQDIWVEEALFVLDDLRRKP